MNTKHFLALTFFVFGLFTTVFAQSSGCDSVNTDITSKFRYLGSWDENGTPDYIMSASDDVSQALLDYVNEIAPEGEDLHESSPEYFSEQTQLNTVITRSTDVYLTFVHEGAGWKNVLGFYTYPQGDAPQTIDDIDSLTFIFPNVSKENGILKAGDKVHLGHFEAGTVIGYFLMAKGWTGDDACLNSDAHFVFTDKHLNTYTTAEFQQQTILLNYKQENLLLLGIEDIMRPEGDQDFNDAVFYLTSDPVGIDTTDVPEVATATISGGASLCEGEEAGLRIDFTGTGPWMAIYTNGEDTVKVEDISADFYEFSTSVAGEYVLVDAMDALGRGIISGSAEVINNVPTASFTETETTVCNGTEVSFDIEIEGNATQLIYTNGSETIEINDIDGNLITLEETAPFTITLTQISNEQCTHTLNAVYTANVFDTPSATVNTVVCENEDLAKISIDITGGTAPYTLSYSLDGNVEEITTNDNSVTIELDENAEFSMASLSDANCEGITTDEVVIIDCLGYTEESSVMVAPSSCRDEELALALSISELLNVESISWASNGQGNILNGNTLNATYVPASTETGIVEFTVTVGVNGETFQVSGSVEIRELPDAGFQYSPEMVFTEDEVVFTADANDMATYTWLVDGDELTGVQASYTFFEAGIYEVTLIANDGFCTAETTQEIEVLLKNAVYVPNVFNPLASNAENRVVKVYGNNIIEEGFSFRVFNRWGNEIYATNSFIDANQNGWNGSAQDNGEDQSLATFSYILQGNFEDGTKINMTGTITLVN